jgi:hypothetical protein
MTGQANVAGWALTGGGLGRDGGKRVGPSGSTQQGRISFFPKYFSVQKQIQEMPRKCLEARKILRKFRKFQEKFPELDWSMNNPYIIFGAHEKDFRAF